ncbi:MAG TPA: hypothetical protein VGH37_15385 [Candidatus Acidoferrum sp.]|jgi:hypothetical protein
MTRLIANLTILKHFLRKLRTALLKAAKWKPPADNPFCAVRYTSVPIWKPWRDY